MSSKAEKPVKMKEDDKWKIESDLSTLRSAAEITEDPKRYEAALKMAEEQQEDMGKFIKSNKGLRSK